MGKRLSKKARSSLSSNRNHAAGNNTASVTAVVRQTRQKEGPQKSCGTNPAAPAPAASKTNGRKIRKSQYRADIPTNLRANHTRPQAHPIIVSTIAQPTA